MEDGFRAFYKEGSGIDITDHRTDIRRAMLPGLKQGMAVKLPRAGHQQNTRVNGDGSSPRCVSLTWWASFTNTSDPYS